MQQKSKDPSPYIFKKPDVSRLKDINPEANENTQPRWIGEKHPAYAESHGSHHGISSVRQFMKGGHHVKITTTYHIEIDDKPVFLHAIVDNEGKLRCHTTPYETYISATELVKTLMERFPGAFAELKPEDRQHKDNHKGGHKK